MSFTSLVLFSDLEVERQTGLDTDGQSLSPRQSEGGMSPQGWQTQVL